MLLDCATAKSSECVSRCSRVCEQTGWQTGKTQDLNCILHCWKVAGNSHAFGASDQAHPTQSLIPVAFLFSSFLLFFFFFFSLFCHSPVHSVSRSALGLLCSCLLLCSAPSPLRSPTALSSDFPSLRLRPPPSPRRDIIRGHGVARPLLSLIPFSCSTILLFYYSGSGLVPGTLASPGYL